MSERAVHAKPWWRVPGAVAFVAWAVVTFVFWVLWRHWLSLAVIPFFLFQARWEARRANR